jgi:hypothetical protein
MRTWAEIDSENIVVRVLAVGDEKEKNWLEEKLGGSWVESATEDQPSKIGTKNLAGVGYTYNSDINAFMTARPYPSWSINIDLATWEAPSPKPNDDAIWNEETTSWEEVTPEEPAP